MANLHFTRLPLVGHLGKCQIENINPEKNHGQSPLHSTAISGPLENSNPENNHGQPPLNSAGIKVPMR